MFDEQEQDEGANGRVRGYTPAYIPIQTLMSFLESLDPKAIPRHIDRSMMPTYSGGVQRKLMSALAFLGLIRPGGEVAEQLHELVRTRDDPEPHKAALANTIQTAYAKIVGDLDVGTATAKQLIDAFKAAGVEGATLPEAIRFYVKARQAAGLPVSKYIAEGKSGAAGARSPEKNGTKPRPERADSVRQAAGEAGAEPAKQSGSASASPLSAPPGGTIDFPIYFKGKPNGVIRVPDDLTEQEFRVVELTLNVVKAYAAQGGGSVQNH